eukprot:gene3908-8288_t
MGTPHGELQSSGRGVAACGGLVALNLAAALLASQTAFYRARVATRIDYSKESLLYALRGCVLRRRIGAAPPPRLGRLGRMEQSEAGEGGGVYN